MSTGWTTVEHVAARYTGTLTDDQRARVRVWIGDAERRLVGQVPRLAERVDSGELDVRDVQRIVAGAVIRQTHNPHGLTQHSVAEGGFNASVSYNRPSGDRPGAAGPSFTEDELEELRPRSSTPDGFGIAYSEPSPRWGGVPSAHDAGWIPW